MRAGIVILILLIIGCSEDKSSQQPTEINHTRPLDKEIIKEATEWTNRYDFDGDGENDTIIPEFTGGGHCCYRLSVELTSLKKRYDLPFNMDGGYVGGLNLSQPQNFDIRNNEAGTPEIIMQIETYNGEIHPISAEWTKQYGFKTNRIAVNFLHGKLEVRDYQ